MYAISPTDIDWFHYLRTTGFNSQINFWTPTPWNVSKLAPGDDGNSGTADLYIIRYSTESLDESNWASPLCQYK